MDLNFETNNAALLRQRLFAWKRTGQSTMEFFVLLQKMKESLVFADLLRVFVPLPTKSEGLYVLAKDVFVWWNRRRISSFFYRRSTDERPGLLLSVYLFGNE